MHLKCNNKVAYICGDFNVNLLNADTHKDTYNFSEMMCAHGLFPLIDKPTRIDIHSSTLIDNIFTNNVSCNCKRGILMNDISDHLPIFTCCEQPLFENRTAQFKFVRENKNENICKLMPLFHQRIKPRSYRRPLILDSRWKKSKNGREYWVGFQVWD